MLKLPLLKTYYSSLHCCLMWTKFSKSTIDKVNVVFNKVLNVFMNVPSCFSPSWLFPMRDVLNFPPLRRKLVLSFMKRTENLSNVLISNSYNFLMTNVMQPIYWNLVYFATKQYPDSNKKSLEQVLTLHADIKLHEKVKCCSVLLPSSE